MEYGDVLKYRREQESTEPRFMFMARLYSPSIDTFYNAVMVLRTWEDDDLWAPGDIINAGINELIPAEDE